MEKIALDLQDKKFYSLAKEYQPSNKLDTIAQNNVRLSVRNPNWITMINQALVLMAIVFLVVKFLF